MTALHDLESRKVVTLGVGSWASDRSCRVQHSTRNFSKSKDTVVMSKVQILSEITFPQRPLYEALRFIPKIGRTSWTVKPRFLCREHLLSLRWERKRPNIQGPPRALGRCVTKTWIGSLFGRSFLVGMGPRSEVRRVEIFDAGANVRAPFLV